MMMNVSYMVAATLQVLFSGGVVNVGQHLSLSLVAGPAEQAFLVVGVEGETDGDNAPEDDIEPGGLGAEAEEVTQLLLVEVESL